MIIEGAIIDGEGSRSGYVRFKGSKIVETGALGTDSTRGRVRRVRGIVLPAPVNGHTHLGDAVSTREPPPISLSKIVAPPRGMKFRLLRETPAPVKIRAMRSALSRMSREGIAATIDFREEGIEGLEQLGAAARESNVRVVALGRPLKRPINAVELAAVLQISDGVGLSSARDEDAADRGKVALACHRQGKWFALHASESVRENPDEFLRPKPDLLVHLTRATDEDFRRVAEAGVTVAVCPRSNALFGRRPNLSVMARLGVRTLLGTDNVMFHAPSIWREIEFAYISSRLARKPVSAEFLVHAVCVQPWIWLHQPTMALVQPGACSRAVVFRLPPDDPSYQVVTRATEHLMIRPGRPTQ